MGNASPFSYQFNISRACIAVRTFQSSFAPNHIVELTILVGQLQCWWRFLRFILGSDIMEGCWKFPWTPKSLSSVFCCEVSAVAIARNEFHDEFEAF
jgi:hypothetical protein